MGRKTFRKLITSLVSITIAALALQGASGVASAGTAHSPDRHTGRSREFEPPAVGRKFSLTAATKVTTGGPAAREGVARSAVENPSSVTDATDASQGLFVAPQPVTQLAALTGNEGGVVSLASGEFSSSGHQDVAAVICNPCGAWAQPPYQTAAQGQFSIAVLPGNGDGTFGTPTQLSPVGPNVALDMIVAADLGNGHDDLIVSENNPSAANPHQLLVYLGKGDGTFESPPIAVTAPGPIVRFQVADLGDGHPDLVAVVTGGASGNEVVIFKGDGTGNFTAETPMPMCPGTPSGCPTSDSLTDLVVAPLTVGGEPDVLVSQETGYALNNGYENSTDTLAVFINNGNGAFAAPSYPVDDMNSVQGIEEGDFTGSSGPPEVLLVGTCLGGLTALSQCQLLLVGNGDGTFETPSASNATEVEGDSMRAAVTDTPVTFASGGAPSALWLTSYGNNQSATVEAMVNDGSGTFSRQELLGVLPGGVYASAALPVDLAGDDQPDLVVGGGPIGSPSSSPALWVVPANTNDPNTFLTAQGYLGYVGPQSDQSVAVGDFAKAGNQDIVEVTGTGVSGDTDVTLLPGNGDGTFGAPQTETSTGNAAINPRWGLVSGDFSGNGDLDIAYLDNDGGLDYQMGNGNGTFGSVVQVTPSSTVGGGHSAADLVLTTLNGEPDIIASVLVSSSDQYLESWLWNPVTSAFGAPVVSGPLPAVSYGDADIAVGHFNAGDPVDLATVIQPSGGVPEVDVITGSADGSFNTADPTQIATPCSSATGGSNNYSYGAIAVGDLGNGNDDIVWQCIGTLNVALGKGNGTFQTPVTYSGPALGNNAHLLLTDLEGNGHVDAVAWAGDGSQADGMTIWHNNGDGTFAAGQPYSMGIVLNGGGTISAGALTSTGTDDLMILGNSGTSGTDQLTVFLATGGRPSLETTEVGAPSPSAPAPGNIVTGSYQVTDTGAGVSASWVDSVYLAPGPTGTTWTDSETLLGRVSQTQSLAGGGSYTGQYSFALGDVPTGTYHLVVVPDSGDVLSGGNETAGASTAFTIAPVPTLSVGSPVSTDIQTGQTLYYQVNVTAGTDVQVEVAGLPSGSGVTLLGQNGQVPTAQTATVGSASTTVTLPGSSPGTWYIAIEPSSSVGASSVPITVSATNLGMTLDAVSPSSHVILVPPPVTSCVASATGGGVKTACSPPPPPPPCCGDGLVTLTLQGSGFGSDLTVQLVDAANSYAATTVTRRDSTVAFASFRVATLADLLVLQPGVVRPGIYSVVVSSGGQEVSLAQAFRVAEQAYIAPSFAPTTPLSVSFSAPAELRQGWVGQLAVTLTNNTDTDIAVPVIDISSTDALLGGPGVTDPNDFTSSIELDDPVLSADPLADPSPPGILGAGQSDTIDVGILAGASDAAHQPLDTTTTIVNSTDGTLVNWSTLLAGGAPSGMSAADWNSVINAITATYGPTVGTYAEALVPLIAEAQADGVHLASDNDVLKFLLEKEIRTGGPVGGVLTDTTTGQPLANTSVSLTDPEDPSHTYQTTSWDDGAYSLWGVPAGTYDATVSGFLPRSQQVTVPASGVEDAPLDVTDGAALTGTVTDSTTDDPVAGATVAATDADGTLTATSASNGTYTIHGLDAGSVTLQVEASGYVESDPSPATLTSGVPTTDNLTLEEAGGITGTITAEGGGAPPSGTTVSAASTQQPISGVVQSDGSFTIEGLEPGTYSVTASAPDAGAVTTTGVAVSADHSSSAGTLALAAPATLTGTVTDAVTDDPIAGAAVLSNAPGAPAPVTTSGDGNYTISGLPAGSQQLTVVPPDPSYAEYQVTVDLTSDSTTQNVSLDPTGTLTATIDSGADTPLAGIMVDVVGPSASSGPVPTEPLVTTSNGQVTAAGLADGSYDLQLPGSDVHQSFDISGTSLTPSITLSVPSSEVTGQVFASGTPAVGVPVSLVDSNGVVDSTVTGSDGSYVFETDGLSTADVVAASSAVGVLIAPGISISAGATTTVANLQAGTSSLEVTVSDGSGPVSGALVSLTAGSSADSSVAAVAAATGSAGSADFANLTPGTYQLQVTDGADTPVSESVDVASGSSSAGVTMAEGGTINGTVDSGSSPVNGATVVAVPEGSTTPAGEASTGADGSYSIAGLAPGTYDLSVSAPGDAPTVLTGESVTAGTTTTAIASLEASGASLTLSLAPDSTGAPLPTTTVQVRDSTGTTVDTAELGPVVATIDVADMAVVSPLSPGAYTLEVSGQGRTTSTQVVTIPSGATTLTVTAPAPETLIAGPPDNAAPSSDAEQAFVRRRAAKVSPSLAVEETPLFSSAPPGLSYTDILGAWLHGGLLPPATRDPQDAYYTGLANSALANYSGNGCDDAQLAALKAQLLQVLTDKERAYNDWASANAEITTLAGKDAGELAATAAGGLGALYLGLVTLPYTIDALPLIGAFGSGTTAIGAAATSLSGALGVGGAFWTIYQDIQSGNLSDAYDQASLLSSAASTVQAFLEKGGGKVASILGVGLGSIINAVNYFHQLSISGAELQQAVQAGNNAEHQYENDVHQLLSLITQIADLVSGICPPKPPPPNPPQPSPNQPDTNQNHQPANVRPGDPNEILGSTGDGSSAQYVDRGAVLPYTIFFKNEPTASAPATEVVVTMPLPAGTNPSTLELTGFGFGQTSVPISGDATSFSQLLTDLNLANGDGVSASGSYDAATNTITWTLEAINPATGDIDGSAEGGFLPPDDAAGDGEGYVSFQVDARPGLAAGTRVSAQASIVFDTNAPIATNTWINTIESTAPVATVASLPDIETGPFSVSWSGTTSASPIASYDVYVSTDNGPWTLWQSGVTATSARYPAQAGHLYQFAATATDRLGNTGAIPTTSQAHTTVVSKGYWLVASDGGIFSFGDAHFYGSTGALTLKAPIVGMTATPDGKGYWLVASDGGIFSFGDAHFYGSTGALTLKAPIVGMTATPDGKGYWLVASDGGIFSFGDAHFYGSTGALTLKAPIVGMAVTPDGKGYWLVASDGGIFSFGDAHFYGSTGALTLKAPIVGMTATPDGKGYWLAASDGGIFSFGDAHFYGSTGAFKLAKPIIGLLATPDGEGYQLVASDGGVFDFGNAKFYGSTGAFKLAKPIIGVAANGEP